MSHDPFEALLRKVARAPNVSKDDARELAVAKSPPVTKVFHRGDDFDGAYEIDDLLGVGGFGRVYSARERSSGETVAIKVLARELLGRWPGRWAKAKRRFERERRLGSRLEHPNIVRTRSAGELATGEHYIVFDHVAGQTLGQVISSQGPLARARTLPLMRDVLHALGHAHDKGVLHRDIKPANIMVRPGPERDRGLLLDFGIATLLERAKTQTFEALTAAEDIPCSARYTSPEQARKTNMSERSDLYSWGLVVVECLTGEPVIKGESPGELMRWHILGGHINFPDALAKTALSDVLHTVLARRPEDRYADASAILHALDQADERDAARA